MSIVVVLTEDQVKDVLRQYLKIDLVNKFTRKSRPELVVEATAPRKYKKGGKRSKRNNMPMSSKQWPRLKTDMLDILEGKFSGMLSSDIYKALRTKFPELYKKLPFGTVSGHLNKLLDAKFLEVASKLGNAYFYKIATSKSRSA